MKPYGKKTKAELIREIESLRAEKGAEEISKESQQLQAELSALLEGNRAILKYREFKDAARAIFDSCKDLLGATAGYVALLSRDGTQNELLFLDAGGRPCTVDTRLPMPVRGLREKAYHTKKTVYENNFPKSAWAGLMPKGHVTLDNVLFAPLIVEGKAVGVIGLANKQGGFTEHDAYLATAFGELAAVALLNSRRLEALEKSEERLRSVVETANDAIVSVNSSGEIIFWNHAAVTIFGYQAEEVIGKPLAMIIPERLRETHEKAVERFISTRKTVTIGITVECTGTRKDGGEFPLELSVAKWETIEGIFFTGLVRDITERKQAEEALRKAHYELEKRVEERTAELRESESRYRIVADNTYDWEFWTSPKDGFIYMSPSCKRVTGYDEKEFMADPDLLYQIMHPKDRPHYVNHRREVVQNPGPAEIQFRIIRADGTQRWIGHVCQPVFGEDGRFLGTRGSNRDITEKKLAEEALLESEKRYKKLVESVTDYIYTVKVENGRPVATTHGPACVSVTGYTLEEYEADPYLWYQMIHEEDRAIVTEHVSRLFSGEAVPTIEHRIIHKNGPIRWVRDTMVPRYDENMRLVAYDGLIADITERKQAEAALKRSEESLMNAQRIAHLGSWDWDIVKNALFWSDEIYRIFGLTIHEFGATYEAFLNSVHPEDREFVKNSVDEALYAKKPYSIDHRIILPDGLERIVHEQAEVVFDNSGKPLRMSGTVQDITDRKKLEDALSRFNEELMEKVKERTKELEIAKDMADNANRAKSDFLANMSHELRTPLNSVIGFSELMREGLAGPLSEKQDDFLKDIWESGKHLLRLINDILDLSKVEAGRTELELSDFPLKELLEGSLVMFREKAMKHRIKLSADIPKDTGNIIADEMKIKQVIINLLGNAMKFTPDGGAVFVKARKLRSSELGVRGSESQCIYSELITQRSNLDRNFIEISVADTGIGIAKEDMDRLFKPFQQLAATTTKRYEGTGLGLYLCKKFVELHKGRIWVESEPGKGSKFIFVIPLTTN